MRAKIVTTIGPGGWESHGKRFADSFAKFWPADISLDIWHHDLNGDVPSHPRATFYALEDNATFKKLKEHFGPIASNGKSLNYSFKPVALAASVDSDLDWIAALDADVETMRPVDEALLSQIFDNNFHLTYLYRTSYKSNEGSWYAFNLSTVEGASLLADFWGLYDSLEISHYVKPYDNAILDRVTTLHCAHGLRVKNLSEGSMGRDAFHQSPLGAYMIHYKGPDKEAIANPSIGVPSRYHTLCEVLTHSVAATNKAYIVEVGTWNGSRAVQMAQAAFAAGANTVSYVGFDTFEDGHDRSHEGNGKAFTDSWIVNNRLNNFSTLMSRKGLTFGYTLIKGNTLETLPNLASLVAEASFAYIDGGHSYETTSSDYKHLSHVPYVVFDDVMPAPEEDVPDGPYRAWKEASGQKQLLSSNDGRVGSKQTISLGLVVRDGYSMPEHRTKLQVKPVDSVDKSIQLEYIVENTDAISEWLSSYQAHDRTALLVSAGPTLKDYLDTIRINQAAGAVIFCVKHAYPILRAAGIHPDFTVVLDPRPIDGLSTHGVVRTSLFEGMGPDDKVLLASMTHPSVRLELEKVNARLIGWHAQTASFASDLLTNLKKGLVVGGGTCSATRMPMLAFTMGFRRFEFFGYDFFYPADTPASQLKQSLMKVAIGDDAKEFLTTGELVAAMQDLGQWNKWLVSNNLSVTFHGDGAGTHIWNSTVKKYNPPQEYPF